MVVAAAACAAAATAGASADASCPPLSLEQPFSAFGDLARYFLLPNGSFEAGTTGWALTGGTSTTRAPEPAYMDASPNATSLQVPRDGTATSPTVCISNSMPTMRFFARTTGGPASRLKVDAVVKTANGKLQTLPVANIAGASAWAPTQALGLKLNAIAAVSKQSPAQVSFRFTAQNGTWQIDRTYVDPLKECC